MLAPAQDRSLYNFPVALRPVFDDHGEEIPHTKNVQRLDNRKSLAVVSDRYKLIPHQQMVEAFEPFGTALGAHTTHFFQERDGARVVMQQTFRDITFRLRGHNIPGQGRSVGDVVGLRTHAINSYNTTTPLCMRVGCLVLRCLNGATAMESFFGLNIKHVGRGEAEINLPTPEAIIDAFNDTGRIWEEWADRRISQDEVGYLMSEASHHYGLASQRILKKEEARFLGVETVWDAFNAFTHIITHESRRLQETSRLSRFDRLNMLMNSFVNPTPTE